MPDNISENESRRIQLKVWLSQNQMSQKTLAATLGVSESAVYGWCSNHKIPDKRWQEMKSLFCKDSEQPEPGCIAVQVEFPDDEWEKITATIPDGIDKVEFVKQTMLRLIKAARLPMNGEQ
jgi:hypothetical protein